MLPLSQIVRPFSKRQFHLKTMKLTHAPASVLLAALSSVVLPILPSCTTGPAAARDHDKNAGTIACELATEAATKVVEQFASNGSTIEGQKLALIVRQQPIRMAMPVTTRRAPSGNSFGLGDLVNSAMGEVSYEQNEVELTADIKSAVEEGVIQALMPGRAYVFASASVDSILESMGVRDAQQLLVPDTFDKFKERIRADAGQSTLDGLLIAVHSGDQVKRSKSLDFKVRITYVDMRPIPTAPVIGVSNISRGDAEGIFRPVDGPVVANYPSDRTTSVTDEAPAPRASGGDPEGDTMATARELAIGAVCRTDIGRRGDANDYFRFTAPQDGFVTIEMRNGNPPKAGGQFDWEVADSGDKRLHAGREGAGRSGSRMISVSAGSSYYVKVNANAELDQRVEYALSTVYSRN